MNRTLKEQLPKILLHDDVKNSRWLLALPSVTFLHNILPCQALAADESPFIKALGIRSNLQLIKVWGCMAQYLVPVQQQRKLASKAR